MGDLEAELARFEAELASVSRPSPAAPPPLRPPPTLPPPSLPPPRLPPPGHGPSPLPPPMLQQPGHGPPMMPPPGMMHPGMPPPGMMPPPMHMAPPPMMPPPLVMPPPQQYAAAAAPPQQQYGGGAGPSIYAAPAVYSAPVAAAPAAILPAAAPSGAAAGAAGTGSKKSKGQAKVGIVRQAAGTKWVDPALAEWPDNDFRIFVGNLGNEVSDALLTSAFSKYTSFNKAKVIKHTHNNKSKGYGFVSLTDNDEGFKALREMNGKYIGNRPVQVKRSNWDERNVVDNRTGKAKKRQIMVRDKPVPNKRPAPSGGILHR